MRYPEKEFTGRLKNDIERIEAELRRHLDNWLPRYQGLFLQNYRVLEAGIEKQGADLFLPDSKSSLVIQISDDNGELIDSLTVDLWTCDRYFLGVLVSKKFPGSKLVGELIDKNPAEIKEEMQAYIDNFIGS